MNVPADRRYTDAHEWIQLVSEAGGTPRVRIGITDFAQDALGDIVFVELPEVGKAFSQGETLAEVESTKSVGEVYAAVAGTVSATNGLLDESPERINSDPYGDGWVAEIDMSEPDQFEGLLTAAEYEAVLAAD